MLGNASFALDDQHMFGGKALARLEPLPDGRLTNAADAGHGALRTGAIYGGL